MKSYECSRGDPWSAVKEKTISYSLVASGAHLDATSFRRRDRKIPRYSAVYRLADRLIPAITQAITVAWENAFKGTVSRPESQGFPPVSGKQDADIIPQSTTFSGA